jgi:phosphinothricin acetyltransferase
MALLLRQGEARDLNRLVEVYNHYVSETHITFDTEPFAVAARTQWFSQFGETGPHRLLVAQSDEDVIGYACSTSVETTIYLDHDQTGNGFGEQLYAQLLQDLIGEESVHRAYGGIALPNPGAVALHRKLGFVQVASYHEVGYKFARYWDVDWFEKDVA